MTSRSILILTFIFLGLVVLGVSQIFVSNILSTQGNELSHLRDQASNLREENDKLKSELLGNLSLNSISERSSSAGFIRDDKPIVLGGTSSIFALK